MSNTAGPVSSVSVPPPTEDDLRHDESKILHSAVAFRKEGNIDAMSDLITQVRPFLGLISKAKAAKLVRVLVDMFLDMHQDNKKDTGMSQLRGEVEVLECIDWAKEEKRMFLRRALEARLVGLYYETERFTEAIKLGSELLTELKKLDDKNLLVEVLLLESKTYHALGNLQKARVALTSARTTANSIYVSPKVQAQLDLQAGVLHASEEKDFKIAFSYFYEAFEQYDSVDSPAAIIALKYMLMCKIMLGQADEVLQIANGKLALKYIGPELAAMKKISMAAKERSLADFQTALRNYKNVLQDDRIVNKHLATLYQTMLEQNLNKIVFPYSRLQVDFIASKINLPVSQVQLKLAQMIRDKKLNGILDHQRGQLVLLVFEDEPKDVLHEDVLATIKNMGRVVNRLSSIFAKKL